MVQLINKLIGGRFPLDGFDPDVPYQMVPANGETRDIALTVGSSGAKLSFSRQNIALVGNLRDFDTNKQIGDGDPLRFSNTMDLPADKKVIVAVKSFGTGTTFLQARDGPSDGITIDLDIQISIKPSLERKFSFLYVSDIPRTEVRDKFDPRTLLAGVKAVFLKQANITLTEVGAGDRIPELHVLGDLEDPINLSNAVTLAKIDARVTDLFPGLFKKTDFIVYIVWKVRGKHPKDKTLGMNVQTSDNLNTVYLGLEATTDQRLHTMAHEFGHAMGLPHAMENCLMFPTTSTLNNRLLGGQVEQLHVGPIFPVP